MSQCYWEYKGLGEKGEKDKMVTTYNKRDFVHLSQVHRTHLWNAPCFGVQESTGKENWRGNIEC